MEGFLLFGGRYVWDSVSMIAVLGDSVMIESQAIEDSPSIMSATVN